MPIFMNKKDREIASKLLHVCREDTTCCCSSQALEPNENCPIHGGGTYPKRCYICGRFMKRESDNEMSQV